MKRKVFLALYLRWCTVSRKCTSMSKCVSDCICASHSSFTRSVNVANMFDFCDLNSILYYTDPSWYLTHNPWMWILFLFFIFFKLPPSLVRIHLLRPSLLNPRTRNTTKSGLYSPEWRIVRVGDFEWTIFKKQTSLFFHFKKSRYSGNNMDPKLETQMSWKSKKVRVLSAAAEQQRVVLSY